MGARPRCPHTFCVMRWLLVWVCALLISAASACSNDGGSGGMGGAGGQGCAAPLADYCEGADCPSYEEAVETAKDWRCEDISDSAEVGTCGDLMYASLGLGIGSGQEQYFDAEGTLTAIYFHTDTPSYCAETSFGKWYGPAPECEQTPGEIFCSGGI